MSERPRIGWLCNSAIGTSETFLVDNLKLLQEFAEVKGIFQYICSILRVGRDGRRL